MEDSGIDIHSILKGTNFFIYKEKLFPFNIVVFNCFSQYFTSNQIQVEPNSTIKLLEDTEDTINLSEESINDFINYCQNQQIKLNRSNAPALRKLSKKYIVPSLLEATEQFITSHRHDLVVEYLNMKTSDNSFDTSDYEDMISKNMLEYIKDENLPSLPIPVLHRIVSQYVKKNRSEHQNFNDKNHTAQPPEFIEFLMKCIDRRGREASVLFDQVDICDNARGVIDRLLKETPDKFDFHFINRNHMKTFYEVESELLGKEEIMREEQLKMRNEQERIREENEQMKKEQSALKRENEQMKQDQSALKRENERMKLEQKENLKRIDQIQSEFVRQFEKMRIEMKELKDKLIEQNKIIKELKTKNNEIQRKVEPKPPSIIRHFSNDSDPRGIISLLGDSVTLTAGGDKNPSHPLSNIKKYDNNYFYNCYNSTPSSESASFIKFDFGPSKKIDLHSYFIRSNGNSPSSHNHPKSWRVEGSNDNLNWIKLDQRVNDQHLNGSYYQHNFLISSNNHGCENMRFRYIRYVQEDSWFNNSPYVVFISYFELFGDIFE